MSKAFIAHLADRGGVSVSGADAVKFLNGLATNELGHLQPGEAAHAGLLSPQGKILFDFLAVRSGDGFLLDTAADRCAELVKRLSMYKLRAAVSVTALPDTYAVYALWGPGAVSCGDMRGSVSFRDPRHAGLGSRILAEDAHAIDVAAAANGTDAPAQAYHAHRISLGVPEGGKDYAFGDAYPHEANFDLLKGVSFKKGCYVGQEVVSRMQHKTVVRKRVVRVEGESNLAPGVDVTHNGIALGRTGSVAGREGLSLLRLDRYAEAIAAHDAVVAGEVHLRVHPEDFARYTTSASAKT